MLRILLVVAVAGCAPVLRSASPDHVSIEYADSVTLEDTQSLASQTCAQYGKRANYLSSTLVNPNALYTGSASPRIATYECVN